MTNNIILKNTQKYGVLKLASGIDLKEYKKKLSDRPHVGISTETYRNYWFVDNQDQRGIFKTYDKVDVLDFIGQNRIINEMLCQEIGKQIGVKIADYRPAHIDDKIGTLSYDVASKREEVVSAHRLLGLNEKIDLKNLSRILKDRCAKEGYFYESSKMIFDLYKMMVFDALTFQEDRRGGNIHFVINPSSRQIRLSPLIDNELAFGGKLCNLFFKNNQVEEMSSVTFLANHGKFMDMTFSESQHYEIDGKKRYKSVVKSLVKLSKKSKLLENFLDEAIQNFDIKSAIKNVENMGYDISDNYKEFLLELENMSKQVFLETKLLVDIYDGANYGK